jgi:hypothetical protein
MGHEVLAKTYFEQFFECGFDTRNRPIIGAEYCAKGPPTYLLRSAATMTATKESFCLPHIEQEANLGGDWFGSCHGAKLSRPIVTRDRSEISH